MKTLGPDLVELTSMQSIFYLIPLASLAAVCAQEKDSTYFPTIQSSPSTSASRLKISGSKRTSLRNDTIPITTVFVTQTVTNTMSTEIFTEIIIPATEPTTINNTRTSTSSQEPEVKTTTVHIIKTIKITRTVWKSTTLTSLRGNRSSLLSSGSSASASSIKKISSQIGSSLQGVSVLRSRTASTIPVAISTAVLLSKTLPEMSSSHISNATEASHTSSPFSSSFVSPIQNTTTSRVVQSNANQVLGTTAGTTLAIKPFMTPA